ncbi:MAG TPA: DUF4097 family beta strand repeat-containing protein [Candidatus Angelobacter sp.]
MTNSFPHYRRRSLFGPLLVVAIGVIILLANIGYISRPGLFHWFSRYWPVVLIVWGVTKFIEYTIAKNRNEPYPGIGAGGVVFVVFLVMFGMAATGVSRVDWGWVDIDPGDDFGDWGVFGNRYEFTQNFATPMPAGTQVRVLSTRGDITITPSPDNEAHAFIHKFMRGHSQDEANQFNNATQAKFEQQGSVWVLDMTGGSFRPGRFNMELQLPPKYAVSLVDNRGDVRISQIQSDIEVETSHGDITAEQIKGNALLRAHHGDVSAKSVNGNLNVDGDVGDSTVSDVGGTLTFTGSYSGDIQLSRIGGEVRFTSIRTDLQLAKLDGDLSMDRGDLKGSSITGPFTVRTETKDISLENITGDIHIQDRRGDIEIVTKAPVGNMDIITTGGEINVHLPEQAGFQVDAESNGGEIQSDFGLNINNQRGNATATGTVGKGGPVVKLKTSRGTIQIHKQ